MLGYRENILVPRRVTSTPVEDARANRIITGDAGDR